MSMFAQHLKNSRIDTTAKTEETQATEGLAEDLTNKKDDDSQGDDNAAGEDNNQIDLGEGEGDISLKTDEDETEDDKDMMDDMEDTSKEMEMMETEMSQLLEATAAIESYGINPAALGIMKATGLLNGTALETIGLEAYGNSAPSDIDSQVAVEALTDKMKEMAAKWSAKIISVVKNTGGKLMSTLSMLWEKITGSAKKAAANIKETATAHPYATTLAVVGSIAAVAAVVAYAGGNLPGMTAKPEMFKSFTAHIKSLFDKIKSPFMKIDTSIVGETTGKLKVAYTAVKMKAESAGIKALGWTATAVKSIEGQLGRAWSAIKTALGALSTKATSVFSAGVDKADGVFNKLRNTIDNSNSPTMIVAAWSAMYAMILLITTLVLKVVLGGFRMILSTFNAITGSKTAEA